MLGRVGGETKEEVVEGLYGWLMGEEDGEEEEEDEGEGWLGREVRERERGEALAGVGV